MNQKPHAPSPQDYFELMQKMANPGGQSFQSLFFPPLDVKEIDKKIVELKSVEQWLQASLGMLQLSIQTLEYQKALLSPPKEDGRKAAGGENAANPAMWAWQMMNQATEQFQAAAKQAMTMPAATASGPSNPAKPKARASSRNK